ncbi:MAG: hypothetical protein AAB610_02415 [Patescibacteria group bacterium]
MASSSDNFKKMFLPEHPHLRLHVLLSILAFVLAAGSVTLYQVNKAEKPQQAAVSEEDPNELIQAKARKLAEVSESLTVQPQTPQFEAILEQVSKSLNQ